MAVDFEDRVDFRRLRDYRLARARAALAASDLGALLLFDVNNIRYVTSTMIGEWARDKMCRYALLARRRRANQLGLRLRGSLPPTALPVAEAGELQGGHAGPAWLGVGRGGLVRVDCP